MLDSIIIRPIDVTFDLIWRRGDEDTVLITWQRHWEPLPGASFDAQAYEVDMTAPAIDVEPGDKLVFRYSGMNAQSESMTYIPNGDGELSNGRIPNITLP